MTLPSDRKGIIFSIFNPAVVRNKSISSRKGMFLRYKGWRLAHRWMASLPREITQRLTMTDDCRVVWNDI